MKKQFYQEGRGVFLYVKDKKKYLHENRLFKVKMTDELFCLHCGEKFKVCDYKVRFYKEYNGDDIELISCPNAPKCDGTMIDWVEKL